MNNNDVLRRIRYTFNLNDEKMMELFKLGGYEASRAEISDWLKQDEDPNFSSIYDKNLAVFLNGFIVKKRGSKDGETPIPEKKLSNNQVLRKLKIALNLKDIDMIEILALAGVKVSKHELSAFFRNPNQNQYRVCKDQFLRKFLQGMQKRFRKE